MGIDQFFENCSYQVLLTNLNLLSDFFFSYSGDENPDASSSLLDGDGSFQNILDGEGNHSELNLSEVTADHEQETIFVE